MKHLLLIVSVAFFACSHELTFEERVRPTLDDYFKKNIDDAKSYEFVSIEDVDTFTFNKSRRFEIELLSTQFDPIYDKEESINRLEKSSKELLRYLPNDYSAKKQIEEVAADRKQMANDKIRIDSFTKTLSNSDSSTIKELRLYYKFRAKNATGALELNKYYVRLNPDLSFLSASKKTKKE